MESLQHQQFPGGLPSQYYADPTLLNFSVQMGTGAFNVVWPQTTAIKRNRYLYQSPCYLTFLIYYFVDIYASITKY